MWNNSHPHQPQVQPQASVTSHPSTSHDEDEEEIAQFLERVPREYERLSVSKEQQQFQQQQQQRLRQHHQFQQQQQEQQQMNSQMKITQQQMHNHNQLHTTSRHSSLPNNNNANTQICLSSSDMNYRNPHRDSTLSIDSSLIPGTMSGAVSRKRRSHSDIANAAAEVTALFHNHELGFLDPHDYDDEYSYNESDRESCNNSRGTNDTQPSSVTKRSSGTSTTMGGFARLSIYNPTYIEERPRKRRSSSSTISRMDDSIHRLSRGGGGGGSFRGSLNDTFTVYNAASAAVAAEEAAKRLSGLEPDSATASINNPNNNNPNDNTAHDGISHRKFQRRAGFVLSTIETEAAAALATRTELLMKDRYETRRARHRPKAKRRSLSYSTGAQMVKRSSIIDSSVPEDAESILELEDSNVSNMVQGDFMKLTKSRMERRVLSLPDQNAVMRLSETSINQDVDFSKGSEHSSSALSANLEASTAALRRSLQEGGGYGEYYNPNVFLPANVQRSNSTGGGGVTAMGRKRHASGGSGNNGGGGGHFPLPNQIDFSAAQQQQQQQPNNPSSLLTEAQQDINASLKVAAEVFHANALTAQSLAQSAQVAIAMLQDAQETAARLPPRHSSSFEDTKHKIDDGGDDNDDIDYETYDGKISHVEPIEPISPEEERISESIHEAAQNDDVKAAEQMMKESKDATRMISIDSDEGDVPLHVALRCGSHGVIKALLEKDSKCALIRNHLGQTPLHIAADEGNLAAVLKICAKEPIAARVQVCCVGCIFFSFNFIPIFSYFHFLPFFIVKV